MRKEKRMKVNKLTNVSFCLHLAMQICQEITNSVSLSLLTCFTSIWNAGRSDKTQNQICKVSSAPGGRKTQALIPAQHCLLLWPCPVTDPPARVICETRTHGIAKAPILRTGCFSETATSPKILLCWLHNELCQVPFNPSSKLGPSNFSWPVVSAQVTACAPGSVRAGFQNRTFWVLSSQCCDLKLLHLTKPISTVKWIWG